MIKLSYVTWKLSLSYLFPYLSTVDFVNYLVVTQYCLCWGPKQANFFYCNFFLKTVAILFTISLKRQINTHSECGFHHTFSPWDRKLVGTCREGNGEETKEVTCCNKSRYSQIAWIFQIISRITTKD